MKNIDIDKDFLDHVPIFKSKEFENEIVDDGRIQAMLCGLTKNEEYYFIFPLMRLLDDLLETFSIPIDDALSILRYELAMLMIKDVSTSHFVYYVQPVGEYELKAIIKNYYNRKEIDRIENSKIKMDLNESIVYKHLIGGKSIWSKITKI